MDQQTRRVRAAGRAGPVATAMVFGVGTVLTAIGFLVLVASPVSALAIAVSGLLIAGLGPAMVTAPVPSAEPAPADGRTVAA